MAGNMSDYLEDAVLDHVLGTAALTSPTNVYVGLFTSAPTDSGGGTEVSGGGYARKAATFSAASGGATSNSADIAWDAATADWGTVTAVALFDASTTGNMLWHGSLTASKTINKDDDFTIASGELDVSID